MKTNLMAPVQNRKDFERNMDQLAEQLRGGKIHFSDEMESTVKSLMDVKLCPNRRLNFHTVNEMARLMANTAANSFRYDTD